LETLSNTLLDSLKLSEKIPGWTRSDEAKALAEFAYDLPDHGALVEIGSFFGSGAVLLAGARNLRGSSRVRCFDPFDASGDAFSVPHYDQLSSAHGGRPLRDLFDAWEPWLKPGGIIALHKSGRRDHAPEHDGRYRVAIEEVVPPSYVDVTSIGSTTFGRKNVARCREGCFAGLRS